MLSIKQKKHRRPYAIFAVAICLISTGVYFMMLTLSPSVAPLIFTKPIDAKSLPKAKIGENRIVIPRIGVNIHYDKGRTALDRGAEWRQPITKIFDVKPNQTEIEAPSQEAKLTLYSCELGGSDAGRIVITGKLLGQVEQ